MNEQAAQGRPASTDTTGDAPVSPDAGPSAAGRRSFRARWFGGGGPRRRWKLAGLGMAAVAGMLALGACSHHAGHGHGPFGAEASSPEEAARRVDKMVTWVLSDVDATDAQKQQVGAIAKAALKDLAPLRAQHRELRLKTIELMAQPAVDRTALEALRGQGMQLADTASRRVATAAADAMEVLTPQQRAQLAERAKKRFG